jgi:membrane-anchored protein YejM (alkaline phosphatase superfamily)
MRKIDKNYIKKMYWVYVFNLIFVFFIVREYVVFVEDFNDKKAWLYFVTATVSHFMLLVALPLLISLLLYLLIKRKKITNIIYGVLMSILIIALEIDTEVYAQFRYHLSPIVFNLVFGKRATDIFQFSMSDYLATIGFIVMTILAQFIFHFIAAKLISKKVSLYFKTTLTFFLLATFVGHAIYAWSASNFYRPVTQFKHVYPSYYPQRKRTNQKF